MKKLNLGFAHFTDGRLELKAQTIITAMTGNANFPAPHPELIAATAASAAYSNALASAASGDKTLISVKNQARVALIAALNLLGNYVMIVANGDEAVLTSSGFDIRRDATPLPPLSKPIIARLENGVNSGEVEVIVGRLAGARMYQFQYSNQTTPTVWTGVNTTQTKLLVPALEAGKLYWFRVVAYGINRQEVMGDAVSKMVY